MCGIYAYVHRSVDTTYAHAALKPRGPDAFSTFNDDNVFMAFYRLKIVGGDEGMQPITIGNVTMMCNGEIYNYKQLANKYNLHLRTGSDCEIIIAMYLEFGIERTIQELDGEFALIIYNSETKLMHIARDYIGIKPLYMACTMANETIENIEVSSEIKGMNAYAYALHVSPRVIYTYDINKYVLSTSEYMCLSIGMSHTNDQLLRDLLRQSVIKRIEQSDVPVGFMLSGGLDSTLILGIAMQYYKSICYDKSIEVFTFGFADDAPDVVNARLTIGWFKERYQLNINWHLIVYKITDGIAVLPEVIRAIETYDTTTIRASTPMYLLSMYIASTSVKVIISGEGSDELFGGYLYFKHAPNDVAFRAEIVTLLNNLYYFDALRADRSTAAHGLEMRPPFLDKAFVQAALNHSNNKPGANTKQLLRDLYVGHDLIPTEILNGRKEAFSDAVGLQWKDAITEYVASYKYESVLEPLYKSTGIPAETPEMKYYQYIFGSYYYSAYHITPTLWLPNQSWVKTGVEPSARVFY